MTPRIFSLKDDTCFSGIRANPDDCQRGGGYLDLTRPIGREASITSGPFAVGELAAMVVVQGAVPLKPGDVRRVLDCHATRAEREAVAEWAWRTAEAIPTDPADPA